VADSGQPETRSEKMRVIFFLVVFIVLLIFIYVWYTSGTQGIWVVVKRFLIYAIIALIVGLIVYVVMRLLRKEKVDLVENDRKDIIDAGILSKPPMVNDLYATGDKDHGEFRLGSVIGYCQIQSYKDIDVLAGLTQTQIREMEENGEIPSQHIIKEDCFIFKRFPFPFSIFEQPKVMRCFEDEHSQLIGDVKIYCVSVIKKFSYYWPNRGFLDIARIDISVIREAWRGQIHQFLKDQVSIQQRAIGLDSEFKKSLDQRKLLKIPSPMGEQSEREGR
jgi:hypothetical protein